MSDDVKQGNDDVKYPDFEGWLDDNEARFIEADLMPDDGPEHQVNSNFQIRRREQTKLLREVWANCWPDYPPLTRIEANRLLRACNNSATDVAYFTAHAASYQYRGNKPIDTPAAYVLEVIKEELKGEQTANAKDQPASSEQGASNETNQQETLAGHSNGHRPQQEDFGF